MNATNSTLPPPVLQSSNNDSPLEITASVVSLLTFAYAASAGIYFSYRTFASTRASFEQLQQRLDIYDRELSALDRQVQDELKYRQSQEFVFSPPEVLVIETNRIEFMIKSTRKHYDETHEALTSLEKSALRNYGDDRAFVSLFSYYLPCDFPHAEVWFKFLFWCVLPVYTCIIIALNLAVVLIDACLLLDVRWIVGKIRLFTRQEELIQKMSKTEDVFRQVNMDVSRWYDISVFSQAKARSVELIDRS